MYTAMKGIKYIQTKNNSFKFSVPADPGIEISGYVPVYTRPQQQSSTEQVQTAEEPTQPAQETSAPPVQKPVVTTEGKIYNDRSAFVRDMTAAYEKELESRGIDKQYAKYLVAQDSLESRWGNSTLSKYYNFGGIKAIPASDFVEMDTYEWSKDRGTYKTKAKFRKFKDLADYVHYKVGLLNGSTYRAFDGDVSGFYDRIAGKYATDNKYLEKLWNIYNDPIFSAKMGGKLERLVNEINNITQWNNTLR